MLVDETTSLLQNDADWEDPQRPYTGNSSESDPTAIVVRDGSTEEMYVPKPPPIKMAAIVGRVCLWWIGFV